MDGSKTLCETIPYKGLRSLVPYGNALTTITVLADSPIKSLIDFKGKKIATAEAGSTAAETIEKFLDVLGIRKDVDIRYGTVAAGIDGLKDRIVDGFNSNTSAPVFLTELSIVHKFRLIGASPELIKAYNDKFYGGMEVYKVSPLPEWWRERVGKNLVGYDDIFMAAEFPFQVDQRLDEKVAYEIVKILWERKADVDAMDANWKSVTPADIPLAQADFVPFHPGALRYYKEKGWIK